MTPKSESEPLNRYGNNISASKDEPQYLLESDSTGEEAAHKPDALEKVG
ncbi:MAG: DUF2945 domain-containing protein [Cyanobacteria bacterium J06581_3]